MASTTAKEASEQTCLDLVQDIQKLVKELPKATIPTAEKDGKIHRTLKLSGDTPWETFDTRFNALYGADQYDRETQRLLHIERGKYGLDGVCSYLTIAMGIKGMPHVLMIPKLERLKTELVYICDEASKAKVAADAAKASASKPSRVKKPADPVTNAHDALRKLGGGNLAEWVIPREEPVLPGDAKKDKTYVPRKKGGDASSDSEADATFVPGSDGFEKDSPSEGGSGSDADGEGDNEGQKAGRKVKKRTRSRSPTPIEISEDESTEKPSKKGKGKKPVVRASKKSHAGKQKAVKATKASRKRAKVASSSDEGSQSDGRSALRAVQAQQAAQRTGGVKRGPKNETLQHWHEAVATVDSKTGAKRWTFKCLYCDTERSVARTTASDAEFDDEPRRPALTNLPKHTNVDCKGKVAAEEKAAREAAEKETSRPVDRGYTRASRDIMLGMLAEGALNPKSNPTQTGFNRMFSAWLLSENLSFTLGESDSVKRLFQYIQCKFDLPTDTTVRNQIGRIFAELHAAAVREFASVKSKIAYSNDTWTSKSMIFTFAGTIANWIDEDWILIERLVDFKHIEGDEHTGQGSAKAFMSTLKNMGSGEKLQSLTLDNVSANDVMCRTLALLLQRRYGIPFNPDNAHIHCLAHVVNLIVQKILSTAKEIDEDPDVQDYYDLFLKHLPVHFELKEDEQLKAWEKEAEVVDVDGDDDEEGEDADDESDLDIDLDALVDVLRMSALEKLRTICLKIVSSPQNRARFRRAAQQKFGSKVNDKNFPLAKLMVVRDMKVRWNSTQAMMARGLLLQKAIDSWVFSSDKYRNLLLSPAEWESIRRLNSVLEVFTSVTETMSWGKTPTLPWVLPSYEKMRLGLEARINDPAFDPALREACAAGYKKLVHYYDIAKASGHTILATVCHPSLRTAWFHNLGPEMHQKATAIFEHVYAEYAKTHPHPTPTAPPAATSADENTWLASLASIPDVAIEPSVNPEKSEVVRWVAFEGGKGNMKYPLNWWRDNEKKFPVIARMARDFLAIPGASVAVERLFSGSRHVCVDTRESLKAETITQLLCAKRWLEVPGVWEEMIEQRKKPEEYTYHKSRT